VRAAPLPHGEEDEAEGVALWPLPIQISNSQEETRLFVMAGLDPAIHVFLADA
jgi:hypothetical protein